MEERDDMHTQTAAQAVQEEADAPLNRRSREEQERVIRDFLQTAETAVIATAAGENIRLRMMHLGVEDDFCIYLASMRNDPKIVQMVNHPSIAILVHKQEGPVTEAEEVEYTGKAVLLRGAEARQKCIEATSKTSPIVQSLLKQGSTDVLDCIKIVPQLIKYRKFKEIVQGVPPTVLEFPEHRNAVSEWRMLQQKMKNWWLGIRFNSLAGVLVPVVLGTAIAFQELGVLQWGFFFLTLFAMLAVQAGINLLNDFYDYKSGNDEKNYEFVRPFTGGSRVIQLGLLTPLEILVGGSVLCVAALAAGIYLAFQIGPMILVLAALGLVAGVFYNSMGWNFIRARMGEFVIGISFGLLSTLGAYLVQTGHLSWQVAYASLPVAILITAVIYINEFQDYTADQRTGKPTLVVRWGRKKAAYRLKYFFIVSYLLIIAGAVLGWMPWLSLLTLLTIPLAVLAVHHVERHYDNNTDMAPSNGFTAITHLTFGLLEALAYIALALGVKGILFTILLGVLFVGFAAYMYRYTERIRLAGSEVKKAMQ